MKISVIVPVYNAERYLDKLVQSVLSQTYEDYELILVDDSSKDNSYLLMKKYQEMDSRIKAYTKENTGPGLTRKFGFEKSSGDLFFFVIVMIGLRLLMYLEKLMIYLKKMKK
ncbi:glycosyltransferase family 2 protein [Mediterraneibacter gnavus]|uniref:glycosyltransferase family 2 protein n=1 Tax=Mediterraneibacter gnavus TaxID=33038 RepID=UPI0032B87AB6